MSKKISEEPIFVKDSKDLENVKNTFYYKQYIKFNCQTCNNTVNIRLCSFSLNPQFLCKDCKRKEKESKRDYKAIVAKRRATSLEKYGVDSFTKTDAYIEKTKETNQKKYGKDWQTQSKLVQAKIEETSLKRYGTKRPSQAEVIKEKTKEHNLAVWSCERTSQNETVRAKQKKTCLERYGTENPLNNKEIQQKAEARSKKSCIERYGVTSVFKLPDIRKKAEQTCLEKYGVKNYMQSLERKSRFEQYCLENWGVKNPAQVRRFRQKAAKRYVYDQIGFDSSWELAIWIYAKDHNEEIERELCKFEYFFNGVKHYYFPDFLYKTNLIEIKGNQFFDKSGKMICPYNHNFDMLMEAKHQCGLNNNVEFWAYEKVKPFLDYVRTVYGKNYLKSFKSSQIDVE